MWVWAFKPRLSCLVSPAFFLTVPPSGGTWLTPLALGLDAVHKLVLWCEREVGSKLICRSAVSDVRRASSSSFCAGVFLVSLWGAVRTRPLGVGQWVSEVVLRVVIRSGRGAR